MYVTVGIIEYKNLLLLIINHVFQLHQVIFNYFVLINNKLFFNLITVKSQVFDWHFNHQNNNWTMLFWLLFLKWKTMFLLTLTYKMIIWFLINLFNFTYFIKKISFDLIRMKQRIDPIFDSIYNFSQKNEYSGKKIRSFLSYQNVTNLFFYLFET